MKSIRLSIWFALIGLFILLAGCSLGNDATATPTPEPISELATHAKKPDIRGKIVKMIEHEGGLPSIYVEGKIYQDTIDDKAFAKITSETMVFRLTQGGYERAKVRDLVEGINVEFIYLGVVLEKYPPTGNAGEILIIP